MYCSRSKPTALSQSAQCIALMLALLVWFRSSPAAGQQPGSSSSPVVAHQRQSGRCAKRPGPGALCG